MLFRSVMIGLPNYLLIIRPHPNESLSYFYDYFKQHNINTSSIILEKEVELELHFLVSNILITSFSTVGIEFSKYYKPIVILDYLKEDLLDYISSGIGIAVTNKQELQELFNNKSRLAINNQNFTKFLAKYYFQPKKTVSEGILSVIKSSV